jgi:hypothetical protein
VTLSPPLTGMPTPQVLSSATEDLANALASIGIASASAVWPAANQAVFIPVVIDQPRTYVKAWWINGATAAGNVDVGIYTISGTTATRVVASTAVAQAGVSDMQVAATFATTTIGPGLYYLAMSCSLGTATAWRANPSNTLAKAAGCFQALTAHPLPASPTVATYAVSFIPLFGVSELATI